MGLWASRPKPEGVISPRTHNPTSPGPTEAGAATPGPQSSTDDEPADTSQPSAAATAPSGPDQPQPYGTTPASQDKSDSSAVEAISLAAALLGLPVAPGCYSPPGEVPGPWVDLFLERHADSGVYGGLFGASRTTRHWVLQHAPMAHYNVWVNSRLYADARLYADEWVGQLNSLRALLGARGQLPTKLYISVTDELESECALAALPSFIRGVGQSITGLQFSAYLRCPEPGTAFLRAITPAVPNLTTLTICCGNCLLPPPQRLPHLKEIVIKSAQLASCVSVAAYLPQLTSLTFHPQDNGQQANILSALFTAHTTTLIHFHTTAHLSDNALGLLLTYTPALTDLSVGPVTVESDEYSGRVWGVKRLATSINYSRRARTAIEVWQLPYLPTCSTGTVLCTTEISLHVFDDQGIDEDIVACLPNWQFDVKRVHVKASSVLPRDAHPLALGRILVQFASLKAPGAEIRLQGWHWTPAMARCVAVAAPVLAHLKLGVHVNKLTDELLGVVLLMGPHMRRLLVGQLDLHSDQHADKTWPWDEVCITQCDIASLVRLPSRPTGHGSCRVLCGTVDISQDSLNLVGADEVLTRLQHFLWIKPGPADQRRLCLYAPEDTTCEADTHTHLLTLLAVLRAVRLAYPSQLDETTEVVLHKWPITHEVMHALQGLPAWDAALTFQECKWPLAHPEYKQLATCVPTLYWKWNLGFQWPCVRRVESIIGGLESHRSPASLRDMTVTVQNRKAVRAVETRARVGEHVYLHHVDD